MGSSKITTCRVRCTTGACNPWRNCIIATCRHGTRTTSGGMSSRDTTSQRKSSSGATTSEGMSSRDTTRKRKSSGGATISAKVEFKSWVPGNHISRGENATCIWVKWQLLEAKLIVTASHPSMNFTVRLHKSINGLAPLLLKLKYGLQARQLHVQLLDPCIPLSLNKLLRRQRPAAGLINRRWVVLAEKPLHHRLHSGVAE
nr:hypothetical protein Iba_chr01bCG9900 [Ipomoea batatas]